MNNYFYINTFKSYNFAIPKLIYIKKIIYYPNFLNRYIGFAYSQNASKLIPDWHINKKSSLWLHSHLLKINLSKRFFILPIYILKVFYFFKKKYYFNLKKNDVLIFGVYPKVYFHQIIDYILRIVYLKKKFKKIKNIYLPIELKKILNSYPYKKIFSNFSFKYLENNIEYHFNNATYLSYIDHFKSNLYLEKSIYYLNQYFKNIIKLKKNNDYIYISRNNSYRNLLNENDLFDELKTFGFKKFFFEKMSYQQQINLCSEAKIIISYHGSGLTNLIFAKKNCLVIEIFNKFLQNPIYNTLCDTKKIKYKKFLCIKSFKNFDGICNVDEIINFLKENNYITSK
jgi:hypothetical protein